LEGAVRRQCNGEQNQEEDAEEDADRAQHSFPHRKDDQGMMHATIAAAFQFHE
jgi:hypothetical protein